MVGSVAGQRYWSSMLSLDARITSGCWTPDDSQVYLGTASAQLVVMDVHGAMVSQVTLNFHIFIKLIIIIFACTCILLYLLIPTLKVYKKIYMNIVILRQTSRKIQRDFSNNIRQKHYAPQCFRVSPLIILWRER